MTRRRGRVLRRRGPSTAGSRRSRVRGLRSSTGRRRSPEGLRGSWATTSRAEPVTVAVPDGTVGRADTRGGEGVRMRALRASGVLVTRPREALDALARMAATLCGTRIGSINILDDSDQTSVASVGWDEAGLPTVMPRADSV